MIACRFPPEEGALSDAIGYMAGQLTMEKYPDKIRRGQFVNREENSSNVDAICCRFVIFTSVGIWSRKF